jgi:photosystem II stability/assembly factor-like uncharacterized protein
MNKIFFKSLVVVIFSILSVYPQPTWEKIKTPTDFNLHKICYLDSLHCWVAGDSGIIMFSSDQGMNWQMQNSGVSNYLSDIYFLNENLGWAVAFELEDMNIRSKILKTTNGGNIWQADNYRHLNIILTTIFFGDSLNGWIGGEPFDISYTNDGGSNWNAANIDTGSFSNFPVIKLRFSSAQYGFAVGGLVDNVGVVWRTNNSGNIWKAYGIAPDKFDDFLFLDSINVLTLSADIERFYPIGLLNFNLVNNFWTYNELDKYGHVTSLSRRTDNEIWGVLRCDTSFIFSKDTGITWNFLSTNDSLCYYSIAFADSHHGIVAAGNGYVLKYIPEEPVSVESASIKIPEKFILEQNYPNPFNPSTIIRWQSPFSSYQTLKVYDVLGNEVSTLIDEYKSVGIYDTEFNAEQTTRATSLPSGIYFYRLKIADKVETKKMLLLK